MVLKVYTLGSVCDLYKYQIYREVRVHSPLQHENVVHLLAAFQEGARLHTPKARFMQVRRGEGGARDCIQHVGLCCCV